MLPLKQLATDIADFCTISCHHGNHLLFDFADSSHLCLVYNLCLCMYYVRMYTCEDVGVRMTCMRRCECEDGGCEDVGVRMTCM